MNTCYKAPNFRLYAEWFRKAKAKDAAKLHRVVEVYNRGLITFDEKYKMIREIAGQEV